MNYVLSEKAIRWMIQCVPPVCFTDFKGYIYNIDSKKGYMMAVDTSGASKFFGTNPKYQINKRVYKRIIKKLIKSEFIVPELPEPFEEYLLRNNIPTDESRMMIIDEPLLE